MKKTSKKKSAVKKKAVHPISKFRSGAIETRIVPLKDLKPAPKVKENRLWQWLKDGVAAALSNWHGENQTSRLHMVRIETSTGSGFSDVEGCYNGSGFIAELKTVARPATKKAKIRLPHFTTAQALFLAARWDAGEKSWLFVQVGDTRYLVPGNKAHEFLEPFFEATMKKAAVENLFGDEPIDFLLTMAGRN